jgi:TonB family protein
VEGIKGARFSEIFDRESEQSEEGVISLYQIKHGSDSSFLVTRGSYSSIVHPRKVNGQLISYYSNGHKKTLLSYDQGSLHGARFEWYNSGNPRFSVTYKHGNYHGEMKSYYESGALKREELYDEGKQVWGKCYDEEGGEVAFIPYEVMPQFPGGEKAMMRYLASNIRYPELSFRNNVQGLVVLTFIVDKEGEIKNVGVLKSVNKELDREAIRVVRKMPKWKSGLLEGEKVQANYTLPVKFSIK